MREAAQKVVELQRTTMKLRSQLKAKQDVHEQNERLQQELAEYRARFTEQQKKSSKAFEHVRELKALLEGQMKVNADMKKKLKKYEAKKK